MITVGWALNVGADVFVDGYESNAEINTAFMVVVGVVFALGRGKDRDEDKDQDDPDPESPDPPEPDPQPLPAGAVSVAELLARLAQERGGEP